MKLRHAITWIDVAGGAAVTSALALAAYFGLIKAESAPQELRRLRESLIGMQAEHSLLQRATDRNVAEYHALLEAASKEGKLDRQLPVHERIGAFRSLAASHGWHGLQIMPLEWRSVADVAERSFKVTASCGYFELLSFLEDFEASPVWADISHLTIDPEDETASEQPPRCDVELTLNFYESWSAVDSEA